jgi:hypothetical protein
MWETALRLSLRSVAVVAFLFGLVSTLQAEELRVVNWRGQQALRLTGVIEEGTANRFAAVISGILPSKDGARILLLDSPGGSVREALAMSDVMDKVEVHTVIPDGARCASACASIVFIAGRFRTVEAFGLLGQHSCSRNGLPDQGCNDELAKNAVAHGISYGSVAAFVTYTPPEDIQWLSRQDADGWGLTRYPGESESGFQKSEPRAVELITGQRPKAQTAWRIDFREDGYRAFVRPYTDDERELQLNIFCDESLKGRLFVSMEIHGKAATASDAILSLRVESDAFTWSDEKPVIWQADPLVSEVITEVPKADINDLLAKADAFSFKIAMKPPYEPIAARTLLAKSRKVLLFAADNCASGHFDGPRAPLD